MAYKIAAAVMLMHFFIHIYGLPWKVKKWFKLPAAKRIKPLDCEYCLSFWLALLFMCIPVFYAQVVCTLFGAAFIGQYIKK
jgi:hypothetical protein